jgi:hypothetical protein
MDFRLCFASLNPFQQGLRPNISVKARRSFENLLVSHARRGKQGTLQELNVAV